jgi:hypothetical protein
VGDASRIYGRPSIFDSYRESWQSDTAHLGVSTESTCNLAVEQAGRENPPAPRLAHVINFGVWLLTN